MPNFVHVARTDGREFCPTAAVEERGGCGGPRTASSSRTSSSLSSSSRGLMDSLNFDDNIGGVFGGGGSDWGSRSPQAAAARARVQRKPLEEEDDMLAVLLRHSPSTAHKPAVLRRESPLMDDPGAPGAPVLEGNRTGKDTRARDPASCKMQESCTTVAMDSHYASQQWDVDQDDDASLTVRRLDSPESAKGCVPHIGVPPVGGDDAMDCDGAPDNASTTVRRRPHHEEATRSEATGSADGPPIRLALPTESLVGSQILASLMAEPAACLSPQPSPIHDCRTLSPNIPPATPGRSPHPRIRRHGSNMMTIRMEPLSPGPPESPPGAEARDPIEQPSSSVKPEPSRVKEQTSRRPCRRPRRHGSNIMTMAMDTPGPAKGGTDQPTERERRRPPAWRQRPDEGAAATATNETAEASPVLTRESPNLCDHVTIPSIEPPSIEPHCDPEDEGNIFHFMEEEQRKRQALRSQKTYRQDVIIGYDVESSESIPGRPVFQRPKLLETVKPKSSMKEPVDDVRKLTAVEEAMEPVARKRVRFGTAEVRTYRITVDAPFLVSSSRTMWKGIRNKRPVMCPLTLDWAYSPHSQTFMALELGYSSYFCNRPLKPMSVSERRLRVAAVNDWSWEELHVAEIRALYQRAIDLVAEATKWKLLPSKHWHYRDNAATRLLADYRWSDMSCLVDAAPVDRSRHDKAATADIMGWNRLNHPRWYKLTSPSVSSSKTSENDFDSELEKLVRMFSCKPGSATSTGSKSRAIQSSREDRNGGDIKLRQACGTGEYQGLIQTNERAANDLIENGSSAQTIQFDVSPDAKPGEILSQQPTLLDALDSRYRLNQGGRLAIARDEIFHEKRGSTLKQSPTDGPIEETRPKNAAPYEIVPFANMDGLQLTEGRGMPDRRDGRNSGCPDRKVRAAVSREQLWDMSHYWLEDASGPGRTDQRPSGAGQGEEHR